MAITIIKLILLSFELLNEDDISVPVAAPYVCSVAGLPGLLLARITESRLCFPCPASPPSTSREGCLVKFTENFRPGELNPEGDPLTKGYNNTFLRSTKECTKIL